MGSLTKLKLEFTAGIIGAQIDKTFNWLLSFVWLSWLLELPMFKYEPALFELSLPNLTDLGHKC